jgi:hypothetical protein
MTADTTPDQPDAPDQVETVETVEPKLTKAQLAKRAKANVPDELHDQAVAEGWAEGQQGPFAR